MPKCVLKPAKHYIVLTDKIGPIFADNISEALLYAARCRAMGIHPSIIKNPNP